MIAWAQLGIHDKPVILLSLCVFEILLMPCAVFVVEMKFIYLLQVGLLNVDGYYNSLLSFIDKAVEEGFISPSARHIIVSAPTAEELVKKLEVFSPKKKFLTPLLLLSELLYIFQFT